VLGQFDELLHVEKMQLGDGSWFDWEMADPAKLVSETIARCPLIRIGEII
jgi:hypothetical protein